MALGVYICVCNRAVEDLHFILEKQLLKERLTEKGIYSFLQITKQKNAKPLKFKTWYAAKSKWSFIFKIGEYLLSSEIFLKTVLYNMAWVSTGNFVCGVQEVQGCTLC